MTYDRYLEADPETGHLSVPYRLGEVDTEEGEIIVHESIPKAFGHIYRSLLDQNNELARERDQAIRLDTAKIWLEELARLQGLACTGRHDREVAMGVAKLHTQVDYAIIFAENPDAR